MNKQDYLDTLDTFIHQPETVNMPDEIIPVAMWLRAYMPADENDPDVELHSSLDIAGIVSDVAMVGINDISRLLVLNGYSLSVRNRRFPEWIMKPIDNE